MSSLTVQQRAEAETLPARWLVDAMVLVLEGEHESLVEIGGGVRIRAGVIVATFAPLAFERARFRCEPGSEVSRAVERARLSQQAYDLRNPVQAA